MDVTRLRLSDLKKELGRRGLDTAGGLKAELAERLQAALDEGGGGGGGPEKMVGWERLPPAGKNGIHDNTDQGNMQGCQSFEHCNVKKEEECEYEQVVLHPELPGLQSDGIHDNTHQGNMQGCQSFEYCSVKNEDECEYERVILDPELPGLHSEMKSEFKQEEPDSDYNMTASSFNAPSSGYSGASPYDSSVSCHSVPFFGHGISDSPHSLRQQQGRKRPVEGSRSRGYYEHRDGNSDCGVMVPKKAVEAGKRKREMILLEVKKEIIRKHEGGMRLRDLAKEYGKGSSTISGILMMKEKIKGRDAAKGSTVVSKLRPPVLEEVEKLLLLWIEEKQRAGDKVTEAIICGKAKALHADLLNQQPGTSTDSKDFKATRGWYDRFKNRSGIHSVVKHGDAVSADVAEAFATKFLETVVSQGYLPQQVFNCDETLLFWKRMPRGAFITLPGHMKDHLTLLFCANASGDLKVKPLLVYHSESPRAFKKHKVKTEQLSVLWRSNPKAWVTRHLFVEWVNLVFGPLVKQYLLGNNLPLKAVLLMDNAPAHPPGLEKELLEDFNFIKVMFLPPSTTPLLQPMGQQVISSFKKLYTKELFRQCYEMTDRSGLTLCEFWKYHFDIVSCLQIITIAWAGVSQRNLNSAWGNLWPDSVVAPDADAPSPESTVLEEIVSLGRTMGLEVTEEDVYELVEGHNRELTTEDLVELQKDMGEEQISFEEEEVSEEHLSSRELKKACKMWVNLQTFVQQHHPYKALAKRLMNSVDTIIMSTFRGMLKRRHRQQTMDKFLQKKPRHEEEPARARAAPFPSSSKKC